MNIFVILIMGIMFATYQYFATERSSDSVLNKDELRLQAELSCMKQYHDFATTQTELVNPPIGDDGSSQELQISLKGDGDNMVNYTCTGSNDINVNKYCINSAGSKVTCNDMNVKEHCVSTAKYKLFAKEDMYLTSQILKTGLLIAKSEATGEGATTNYKVDERDIVLTDTAPKKSNQDDVIQAISLISCIDIEEINRKNEALSAKCEEGLFPVIDVNGNYQLDADGNPVCSELPSISSCTAHETQVDKPTTEQNCKKIGQTYCCPNYSLDLKCSGDTKKVWKSDLRFFVCDEGSNYCSDKDGIMQVQDDKDNLIKTLNISDAFTPQYINATAQFVCNPRSNKFIEKCKEQTSKDYGYLGVENIKEEINQAETGFESNQPICQLSAKENSNAIQNCSVCELAEFDTLNERWMCASKTWSEIKSMTNLSDYINSLGAGSYNDKGLEGCFSGCSDEQINQIKSGIRNGPDWGLTWNSAARTWSCFNCDFEKTFNNTCYNCDKGLGNEDTCICNDQITQGKCAPHECSTAYQVLIDGECYTKWCNKSILPTDGNIEINLPKLNSCPASAPWMVYNEVKTCVYCIRTPPDRLD